MAEDSGTLTPSARTTQLLGDLAAGNQGAANELLLVVYDELRALAAGYLQQERAGHTLQPTALVHEVYMRLVRQADASWSGRAHFLAVAAKAMRNTLVNHALARKAVKRGGGADRVMLSATDIPSHGDAVDTIALDDALKGLAELDPRKAQVVELRFFGGLTVDEVAHVLNVSVSTVEADWRMARAWLSSELSDE